MVRFGVAAAVALAASTPALAQPPERIPVEALAELPFISEPVLSPDGKRIVARINFDGKERLAIYDLSAGPEAEPKIVPTEDLSVRWFRWAGNERILVGYNSLIFSPVFIFLPATRLKSYDLKAGSLMNIGKSEGLLGDDVIYVDPHGRYILLSAQEDADDTPSVNRVDLATGASIEVQKKKSNIWSWFADAEGTVRGGVSYNDNRWSIHYRSGANGDLRRFGSGTISEDVGSVDSVSLLTGTNQGVIVTAGASGRFGVYALQLGSGTLTPLFEHPTVDVKSIQLSPDGGQLEGVFYEDERLRVKWMKPELEQLQAEIDRTFPGKSNLILTRSQDDNVVLLWSGGADDPGTYYVFNRKGRRMNVFASPYDRLTNAKFAPVKPVTYTARDGLKIPGYLTLPAGREARNLPLIVMPHGGPFIRDSWTFNPWVQLLANRGYAVLQPNFRGSTGYGRDFVGRGSGQIGKAMQDDLDDGIDWLSASGTVDPKRVCIMGASYGGYAALWGAIRNPERYRCAISYAAVTDMRAMIKYDSQLVIARRYFRAWKQRVYGEERLDLDSVSPLRLAGRLRVPVLVAHGEADTIVPADQSKKLVAELKKRAIPVVSAFYAGEAHGFTRNSSSVDFLKRAEAFLAIHNPADAAMLKPLREPELVSGSIHPADYPAAASKKKASGAVKIAYLVTTDGRVSSCKVDQSSGHKLLDDHTCRLAEDRFQYLPVRSTEGQASESWVTRTVEWKLPEAAAVGRR